VWDKVLEELEEVRQAKDDASRAGELGDVLFAVVNLARWFKVDAESALRQTNLRFRTRFKYIENAARAQGRNVADLSFTEMDALWSRPKTRNINAMLRSALERFFDPGKASRISE